MENKNPPSTAETKQEQKETAHSHKVTTCESDQDRLDLIVKKRIPDLYCYRKS